MANFNHKGHVELWNYLAEHPLADKEDAVDILGIYSMEMENAYFCYACLACGHTYSEMASKDKLPPCTIGCAKCPLLWPDNVPDFIPEEYYQKADWNVPCMTLLYPWSNIWHNHKSAYTIDEILIKRHIAKQIRDLPTRTP